ncbi:hypothetical protein PO909_026733 [Leuciscus waleckii]
MATEEANLGGWSTVKPVTEEVKEICIKEKSEIEKKAAINFKDYIPLLYKSQTVAGTNYLVKLDVCQENGTLEDKCVHVMIHQALPCNGGKLTVTGVQYPKTIIDPLVPF